MLPEKLVNKSFIGSVYVSFLILFYYVVIVTKKALQRKIMKLDVFIIVFAKKRKSVKKYDLKK